jgi:hypothetical protein
MSESKGYVLNIFYLETKCSEKYLDLSRAEGGGKYNGEYDIRRSLPSVVRVAKSDVMME